MNSSPVEVLKRYWGYDSFRGSQLQIIDSVLHKNNTLALMPTGGGKSLCYQIPALVLDGICIVVSPLIALMEDQLNALKAKGIKAMGLYGRLSEADVIRKFDNALYGQYKLLYISPERLGQNLILQLLERLPVNLIAIDEAHCISQWGYDFRPAYLECVKLKHMHPKAPIIALTATATPEVVKDIIHLLELKQPALFKDSIQRPNLVYNVSHTEDKNFQLEYLLGRNSGSAVLFVRTRREAQSIAALLQQKQFSSTYFHGGLTLQEKQEQMHLWQTGKARIMVATNAFGMGVDKGDVRMVIHYHMPETLEHYFQEAGRAGRDGKPAKAILLNTPSDTQRSAQYFLGSLPTLEDLISVYRKLCVFFQIAFGELPTQSFNFKLETFCKQYELSVAKGFHVLELLDRHGVISLVQKFKKVTRIEFSAAKQEVLIYLDRNPEMGSIIQSLLRTYGGLFEFETEIQIALLAKKLNRSEVFILEQLEHLAQNGILKISHETGDLEVTFLVPREDKRTIYAFSKGFEKRHELKRLKVKQMIDYVNNSSTCRQLQLLTYFGESKGVACGYCDVCAPEKPVKEELPKLKEQISASLKTGAKTSRELILLGHGSEQGTLLCLQFLLQDEVIRLNSDNTYTLL
ncbi:MAG: hypothetical protein RLZZ241_1970 [Bacteroidota bacterium]